MIAWPRGPFPIRRSESRVFVGFAVLFAVIGAGMLALVAFTHVGRQPALDLLATAGLGETVAAGPHRISCSERGAAGRNNIRTYECSVDVTGPSGRRETLVIRSIYGLEWVPAGRIARIGGGLAAELPLEAIIGEVSIPVAVTGLGLLFAAPLLRLPLRARRTERLAKLARTGRIVEVDLLRRRSAGKRAWEWHYAFDHGGRRYARGRIGAPPARIDSIETRGAALVGQDGESHLLDERLDPLDVPAEEMGRLAEAILAEAASWQPYRMPALDALIAGTADGPERRWLQAWLDAWTDDEQASRSAVERRHLEEFHIPPERVDALLRDARAAATP